MLRIGDVLLPLMQRMDLYQPCVQRQAIVLWPEIVGPHVARNSRAVGIRNRILFVRTSSSAWMSELSMGFRYQYLEQLKARLGEDAICDIRFLPPPLPQDEEDEIATRSSLPTVELSDADRARAQELASQTTDRQLQPLLERVIRRHMQLQQARTEGGWRPCPQCGELNDAETLCIKCRLAAASERVKAIGDMLLRAPWSSPLDVKKRFPDMTEIEYEHEKRHLMHKLRSQLAVWHVKAKATEYFPEELQAVALRYCMLRSGKRPQWLLRQDIEWALGASLGRRYPLK